MMEGIPFFLLGFAGTREEGLRLIADKQLSPSVLGRSAFCEKMLEKEKSLGCEQYVIFASGYDTYSLRNTDKALSVFELDLPEMLADKSERIKRIGAKTGSVFVPCFDYPCEEESKETKTNQMLAMGAGEQMKAKYSDLELKELLLNCGFEITVHLNDDQMTRQFFSDYNHCNGEYAMKAPVGVGYVLAGRKADR